MNRKEQVTNAVEHSLLVYNKSLSEPISSAKWNELEKWFREGVRWADNTVFQFIDRYLSKNQELLKDDNSDFNCGFLCAIRCMGEFLKNKLK